MANNYDRTRLRAAIAQAWQDPGVLHLRDVIKREHDEAQKRPRNEALEKWGSIIDDMIWRDIEREKQQVKKGLFPGKQPELINTPKKDGPDFDRE